METEVTNVVSFEKAKSEKFLELGKFHLTEGYLDDAIEAFQRSLDAVPTADAYTYIAWVLSLKGNLDQSIELCRKAINLDPDFGNAWNDMGTYLIAKKQLDSAVFWLEQAKKAKRYGSPHFPFINLGRVYALQGKIDMAILEFEEAKRIAPEFLEVDKVLSELRNVRKSLSNA